MRRSTHRLFTALLVVLSLLFSQLAMARYVCPQQMTAMAGMDCEGMDMDQPTLCHQHAADPGQHFEAAKPATASPPMLLQVIELPPVPEATLQFPPAAAPALRPPPDPLFLSTLRLRV
ncbi:hypothetical protein [Pelomonas sp. KK5]|uniref:hypothetical protein n=1 Tax=Pelomonas sp. KK5 TaxID=1855730 RepID=UPI00097BD15A|nr:hypothetical protein [Pelomonas sp. KK5]